jgi:hypothetical protein
MYSAFFPRIQPFGPGAPVLRILEAGRSPDEEEERVVICGKDDINALS